MAEPAVGALALVHDRSLNKKTKENSSMRPTFYRTMTLASVYEKNPDKEPDDAWWLGNVRTDKVLEQSTRAALSAESKKLVRETNKKKLELLADTLKENPKGTHLRIWRVHWAHAAPDVSIRMAETPDGAKLILEAEEQLCQMLDDKRISYSYGDFAQWEWDELRNKAEPPKRSRAAAEN